MCVRLLGCRGAANRDKGSGRRTQIVNAEAHLKYPIQQLTPFLRFTHKESSTTTINNFFFTAITQHNDSRQPVCILFAPSFLTLLHIHHRTWLKEAHMMVSITCVTRTSSLLTRPLLPDAYRIATSQGIRQWRQLRWSSHAPSSPTLLAKGQKAVTIQTLQKMHADRSPISMLTAHNFPSALMAQEAGMDMILVGDSLAMVSLGMPDTSEVTLDEMIMSARAVSRAVNRSFTVGDLPMGSYEISPEQALASAIRMVKEGRMQSVKLEGGAEMAPAIKKITAAGIPLCAHIGLTPQRQHALGGFRVQGNTLDKAMSLLKDAKAVEEAGAFAVVLECVPSDIAGEVTNALRIPTIGIGAGNKTSGQVLVQIDMLGVRPPDSFMPKFVKQYGSIWDAGLAAIKQYKNEVSDRSYPGPQHVYKSDAKVTEAFKAAVQSAGAQKS